MKLVAPAALLALCAGVAQSQVRVTVTDVGPGASGRMIQGALRQSHRLIEPDSSEFVVARDEHVRTALIVLGRSARIDGQVDGDVIVVGGNLYIRTGAAVTGNAVAIGGGTYPSSLAYVGGDVQNFRGSTFDIVRVPDGYRLSYRSLEAPAQRPLLFPMFYGFRAPQYDRVNGLSQPFGPSLSFAGERGGADVLVTYRSALGVADPSVALRYQVARRVRTTLYVERTTASNESWIWQDLVNSLSVIALGEDTRNFYRADRARGSLHVLFESRKGTFEPYIGAATENAWSVASNLPAGGQWSVIGRTDSLGMRRPNPAIDDGHRTALLAGADARWLAGRLVVHAITRGELSVFEAGEHFAQFTSDIAVSFPTVGDQDYALDIHAVNTFGDTIPRQRFVYLGGAGTLPFVDMLSQGGDVLLLIDQRYSVPLSFELGWFGQPSLQVRHRIGAAGLGGLPTLEQIVGVGLSLTIIRFEVQMDPASGRVRGAAGFTFSR